MVFSFFSSCKKGGKDYAIYYWTKSYDEMYSDLNEQYIDTLESVENNISYYTNHVFSKSKIDSLISLDTKKIEEKEFIFYVSKGNVKQKDFYRLGYFNLNKGTSSGVYVYSPEYGVVLRGHPTLIKLDSIVKFKNEIRIESIKMKKLVLSILADTILFPLPPSPPPIVN